MLVCHENSLCTGLLILLEQQPDLKVIDTIDLTSAKNDLAGLEAEPPDFVLIECKRIDASVSGLIAQLRQFAKKPQTIVLGASADSRKAALDAGADAFVYEGDGSKRLLTTIRSLALNLRHAA